MKRISVFLFLLATFIALPAGPPLQRTIDATDVPDGYPFCSLPTSAECFEWWGVVSAQEKPADALTPAEKVDTDKRVKELSDRLELLGAQLQALAQQKPAESPESVSARMRQLYENTLTSLIETCPSRTRWLSVGLVDSKLSVSCLVDVDTVKKPKKR